MKIVTAKNGKQTVKMSKQEWFMLGKQAGWTSEGREMEDLDEVKVPATPTNAISNDIDEETEVEAPKPTVKKTTWLDEEKELKPTPIKILKNKAKKILTENPSVLGVALEVEESGNGFEVRIGKKKYSGSFNAVLKKLLEYEKSLGERDEQFV